MLPLLLLVEWERGKEEGEMEEELGVERPIWDVGIWTKAIRSIMERRKVRVARHLHV